MLYTNALFITFLFMIIKKINLFFICILLFSQLNSMAALRFWQGAGSGGLGTDRELSDITLWSGSGPFLITDTLIVNITYRGTASKTLFLNSDISVARFDFYGSITSMNGVRTTIIDLRNYSISTLNEILIINDSKPNGSQTNYQHNLVMNIGSSGNLNIGGKFICANRNYSYSPNSITINNSGKVAVTDSTFAYSYNSGTKSEVAFNVADSPAIYTFKKAVYLSHPTDDAENSVKLGSTSTSTTGKFLFKGDLYLHYVAGTAGNISNASFIFDAPSNQKITYNNTIYYFRIPYFNVGLDNSPNLSLAGSVTVDNIDSNLTINNAAVLDINTRQLNRNSNGGTLFLNDSGSIKLSGSSSSAGGGTATLITGSNFPSGFTTCNLNTTGTVNFNGANQTIPGITENVKYYGNLTMSGGGVKSLSSNLTILKNLNIGSGTNFTPGSKTVTLKSSEKGTANLTEVLGTITDATGQFIIERYIFINNKWQFLATPIDTATSPTVYNSWQMNGNAVVAKGTRITGPAANPAANGLDEYSVSASMKYYLPGSSAYTNVTNTLTQKIANTVGYMLYVRGDRTANVANPADTFTTLSMRGKPRMGNQSFKIVKGDVSVGNPYPSRVDFRNVTKTDIANAFYVWNPSLPGLYNVGGYELFTYVSGKYVSASDLSTVRNFIESGEAFFVQNNNDSAGTLIFKEADKNALLISRVQEDTEPALRIELKSYLPNNDSYTVDATILKFDDSYSFGIDNNDVRKYLNSTENLFVNQSGKKLVINSRPNINNADTIYLGLTYTRVDNYNFVFKPAYLTLPAGTQAFLYDKFLQTETLLSTTENTSVSFNVTANAASKVEDRFMIVFKTATVLPVTFTYLKAIRNSDKSVTVIWRTENESNLTNFIVQQSEDGQDFKNLNSVIAINNGLPNTYQYIDGAASNKINYYRIKSIEQSGSEKLTDIAKVVGLISKSGLVILSNPIQNGILQADISLPGKTYALKLYDAGGKVVRQKNNVPSNNQLQIDVSALPVGVYTLTATNQQEKYSAKVLIQ